MHTGLETVIDYLNCFKKSSAPLQRWARRICFLNRLLLGYAFILASPTSAATPAEDIAWVGFAPSEGTKFYNPVDFFSGRSQSSFPELASINTETMPLLKTMAKQLERDGVPVLVGIEPNYEATFDLYFPTIQTSRNVPVANYGTSSGTETGKLFVIDHDMGHQFAGIPGPRISDLADLKGTKKKLVDILLRKEVFAVCQSSMVYIPAYAEWRDRDLPKPKGIQEYRRYQQGLTTGLRPLSPSEHVSLIESSTLGETRTYAELIRNFVSPQSLRDTWAAGVSTPLRSFNSLSEKTNAAIQSAIYRYLEPLSARYRKNGYAGFLDYAEKLADFSLQPWLVQWADDFKVGHPLDELKNRTDYLIDQFRAGNLQTLVNPEATGDAVDWPTSLLKTEIALFGRRLKEVEITRLADGAVDLNVDETIKNYYERARSVHENLRRGGAYALAKGEYKNLLNSVEKDLPLDEIILWSNRAHGVSFRQFWRNPYALVVPRRGLPPSHFAPETLEAAYRKSKKFGIAVLDRLSSKYLPSYSVINKRRILQNEVIQHYYSEVRANTKFATLSKAAVASRVEPEVSVLRTALRELIYGSLLPQFPEFSTLSVESRIALEKSIRNFHLVIDSEIELTSELKNSPFTDQIYSTLDDGLLRIHRFIYDFRRGHLKEQAALKLTAYLDDRLNLLVDHPEFVTKSRRPNTKYLTFHLPGAGAEDLYQMVDLVTPAYNLGTREPVLTSVRAYVPIQDWITEEKVARCLALLKPEEKNTFPPPVNH